MHVCCICHLSDRNGFISIESTEKKTKKTTYVLIFLKQKKNLTDKDDTALVWGGGRPNVNEVSNVKIDASYEELT